MNLKAVAGLAIAAIMIFLLVLYTGPTQASIVLINGRIYPADGTPRIYEALAIRDGKIAGLGTTAEILADFSSDRTVDLNGRAAVPGLTDAHCHVEGLGAALLNLDLTGTGSLEDIRDRIARWKAGLKPGQWIRGRGWDQNDWPVKAFPRHDDIDAAAGDSPVILSRVDGHAVWVNRRVLEIAGIGRETPDPDGGLIVRDSQGEATGVFVDAAVDVLQSVLPPVTDTDRTEAVRRALALCASLGLTSVHDMGVDSSGLAIYRRLAAAGELPVRVYAALDGSDSALVRASFLRGPEIDLYGGMLTIRAVKLYADGALGSYGAALLEPYSDAPGNRGLTRTSSAELVDICSRALAHGFQVCTHAIGDRANAIVLSAYEKAQAAAGREGRARFRVEHAQVIAPSDIPRFRKLGVIPSMQPTHCTSDMPWAGVRLGNRLAGAYAWRSLLNTGVVIPGGSDFPVEDPNPLLGFYAAITRQDRQGNPRDGWRAEERMTRMEALLSFTSWAAYAAYQESSRGSLETGKLADLVVLSDDIMTIDPPDIPGATADITIMNGVIRHEAAAEAGRHTKPS